MTVLIGIDDTDTADSIGTGKLARMLGESLSHLMGAPCLGVTRHQLLVHPAIAYTSHNSSACIELDLADGVVEIAKYAEQFMLSHLNEGADPGLAVTRVNAVGPSIRQFGEDAQREILMKDDAVGLAGQARIFLRELGGTGDGVIGALAAVGLRAGGNDGRFVEARGARDLCGMMKVRDILERSAISDVRDAQRLVSLPVDTVIDTQDWVRPSLHGGRPVLLVAPLANGVYQTIRDHAKKGKDNEF